jgi:hypothetical protein
LRIEQKGEKTMKTLEQVAGAVALGGVVIGCGLFAPPARAAYVVTLTQEGSNVVATGSGTIDLTGLSLFESSFLSETGILPSEAVMVTGPASGAVEDLYIGFTGPTSFGSGRLTSPPNSGSGDIVGIAGNATLDGVAVLGVPAGYVSGSSLSDSMTFDNATFASLGVTRGTYTWTWGAAADDSFTFNDANDAVPEPSTWIMMLAGFASLAVAAWRARNAIISKYL